MHNHQRTELILLSHIQTISLSDGFFTVCSPVDEDHC